MKGGKINSVHRACCSTTAFVTVAAGDDITVVQSNNDITSPITPTLAVQQGQAFLYNSTTCSKVKTGTASSDGSLVTFSNVPAGTYIIGIKYTPDSVKGASDPGGDVIYTFQTYVEGVLVSSDTDTITLHKK